MCWGEGYIWAERLGYAKIVGPEERDPTVRQLKRGSGRQWVKMRGVQPREASVSDRTIEISHLLARVRQQLNAHLQNFLTTLQNSLLTLLRKPPQRSRLGSVALVCGLCCRLLPSVNCLLTRSASSLSRNELGERKNMLRSS